MNDSRPENRRAGRVAMIGADLPSRRSLIEEVLQDAAVRRAIQDTAQERNLPVSRARRRARRYAREIAAGFSYPFALLIRPVLRWLWRHLYDAVELHHADDLGTVIAGHTPVYLPCHRSHIDYMLLPYLLDLRGLPVPHAAAGDNLNLPLIGRILRWGGGFFLRRSFRGNRLYGAVFQAYTATLLHRGVGLEYFIEGGRSRTGLLLPPRYGLLDLTVRAGLARPEQPLVLIPVHIAYESVAEGRHYLAELAGTPKRRETLRSLWHGLRTLRQRRGEVRVAIGEPLYLQPLLDRQHPDWRENAAAALLERPEWLPPIVQSIARRIATRINDAAVVTPIGLLACVVLDAPEHRLTDAELIRRFESLQQLLQRWRYSERSIVTERNGRESIARAARLRLLHRPEPGTAAATPEQAGLLAWHRNTLRHVLALPALVAACLDDGLPRSHDALLARIEVRYSALREERFLSPESDELAKPVRSLLNVMAELGWLIETADSWQHAPECDPIWSLLVRFDNPRPGSEQR